MVLVGVNGNFSVELKFLVLPYLALTPNHREETPNLREGTLNRIDYISVSSIFLSAKQIKEKEKPMYFHFFSKQITQKSSQIKQTTQTLTQKNITMRELMKNFKKKKSRDSKARTREAWSGGEEWHEREKIEAWSSWRKRKE